MIISSDELYKRKAYFEFSVEGAKCTLTIYDGQADETRSAITFIEMTKEKAEKLIQIIQKGLNS